MPAIQVPDGVPCPQTSTVQPEEGRLLSDGARAPREARTIEQDERQYQTLSFRFNAAQAAAFKAWWRDDLIEGGAWFAAPETWPQPEGFLVKVRRFLGAPAWPAYLGKGLWDLTIDAEVAGEMLLPMTPESHPVDPFFGDVVLLLHGNDTTDMSSYAHVASVGSYAVVNDNSYPNTAVAGGALRLNNLSSNDSHWTYGSNLHFNRRAAFTLEFWLRQNVVPTGAFYDFLTAGAGARLFRLQDAASSELQVSNSWWRTAGGLSSAGLSSAAWHWIVLCSDGVNSAYFIDGARAGSNVAGGVNLAAAELILSDTGFYAPRDTSFMELRYTQNQSRYDPLALTIPVQSAPWPDTGE